MAAKYYVIIQDGHGNLFKLGPYADVTAAKENIVVAHKTYPGWDDAFLVQAVEVAHPVGATWLPDN